MNFPDPPLKVNNQNKGKFHKEPMRTKSNTCKQPQIWESASDQVTTGFGFASGVSFLDQSQSVAIQSWITFDTHLNIALSVVCVIVWGPVVVVVIIEAPGITAWRQM